MPNAPARLCRGCHRAYVTTGWCEPCDEQRKQSIKRTGKAVYATKSFKADRAEQLAEHPFCQWYLNDGTICNAPGQHVDHHRAIRHGGTNTRDNYRTLCISHHSMKTSIEVGRLPASRVDARNLPPELVARGGG